MKRYHIEEFTAGNWEMLTTTPTAREAKTWVVLNSEPARAQDYRIVRIWGGSRLLVRGWSGR